MREVIVRVSDDGANGKWLDGTPVEEIVRCKNCKHKVITDCVCGWYFGCDAHSNADGSNAKIISDNWFCAYGERKPESDDGADKPV